MAQEKNAWQYDSLGKSDATKPDAQRVYEVLQKMLDRWNAHDIEGLWRLAGSHLDCWS